MKKPILLALRCCALLSFLFSFTSYAQNSKSSASKQNSGNSKKIQKQADIYVAGACYNGPTKRDIAVYWKNGQPVALTDGQVDAEATSMAVVGDDIYVLGSVGGQAVYWKNGQETRFRKDEGDSNIPYSIAVMNGDVYVAGFYRDYTGYSFLDLAMYWKNGQSVKLPVSAEYDPGTRKSYTSHSAATYIAVIDDDIYMIGYGSKQLYWKNGQLVQTINELKNVSALTQQQGNAYAVGATGSGQPAYWKNGHTEIISSKKGLATCLAVSGSDVYVAGVDDNSGTEYPDDNDVATCWKNGQLLTELKGEDYFIYRPTSIAVSGNDVYVIGRARIGDSSWGERFMKNGQTMELSPIEGSSGSKANFVISIEGNESTKPRQATANIKKENSVESKGNVQPEKPLTANIAKVLTPQEEADLFFEENKKKPGVLTSDSGLQLEVLKEGKGPGAKRTDKVKIISRVTRMLGKEIKSSEGGTTPAIISTEGLLPGFVEGLTYMNVGSKIRLYVPPKLAYGAKAPGLSFIVELELLEIIK